MLFTHLAKGEGKGVDGGVHNEAVEATHAYQEEAVRDQTAAAVEVAAVAAVTAKQLRMMRVFWMMCRPQMRRMALSFSLGLVAVQSTH